MRRVWYLAACFLSSACGDKGELAPPDAAVDARADATASDCDPVPDEYFEFPDAAVMISGAAGSEDQNFHGQDVTIGDQLPSVALFHFAEQFDSGNVNYFDAVLSLPHAPSSDSCGASCGSCNDITRAGSVDVYVGRNDWNPEAVTWNARDGAGSWQAPGASGPMDRLHFLGTFDYTANREITVGFFIPSLASLDLTGGLTLIVDATQTGDDETLWTKAVIDSTESCGATAALALQVGYSRQCPQ